MTALDLFGWDRLRHGGLLLDAPRLLTIAGHRPPPLSSNLEQDLRRRLASLLDGSPPSTARSSEFARFVLEQVCGFGPESGAWLRGTGIGAAWSRRAVTGEAVRPHLLWQGQGGSVLPVFFDDAPRLGIGRGRRAASHVAAWLRGGTERLALLTNGRGWRLIFASTDVEAWCEWDADLWLEEGEVAPQVTALHTLLQPVLFHRPEGGGEALLASAVLETRKGQAELSAALGERVREAVEILVQGHGDVLAERLAGVDRAEIYRAAVRVVMRMVVVLFAESRDLLPRENPLYHGAYGLGGLHEDLSRTAARGSGRLTRAWSAWPRVLALFRLVHEGSHHPDLAVPAYGGDLFAPCDPTAADGLSRAVAVFEGASFEREMLSDRDVHQMLDLLTRTKVRVRQGRSSMWAPAPVDFSDLSSEYVGILYEGLLDFELRTAPAGDPVVFLALGNQPALPVSRLEAMDDRALGALLESLRDTRRAADDGAEELGDDDTEDAEEAQEEQTQEGEAEPGADATEEHAEEAAADEGDVRHATRTRAETWARRAVEVGGIVRAPRGRLTPERRLAHEENISREARRLVPRVVLPGEWYLVRWGGTRKGAGTFYTRPGLAVPTVARTLRPLAYDPPSGEGGAPNPDAPAAEWMPKRPEEILALRVCDPACGSGTFPVAALRYLTEALVSSLHMHGRISPEGDRAIVRLLDPGAPRPGEAPERLGEELLPCLPDDPLFEFRLRAVLRRHVVERCIYGVDLDPLAVELCRLALWIETMDRTLPFSFLDHKVKCGNALVGAWFDTFQHYPVMAFKNREGGDKNHGNGVHFEKGARTRAIKQFVSGVLTPDLHDVLQGQARLFTPPGSSLADVHAAAMSTLARLHALPVQDAAERARLYRDEIQGSSAWRALKDAMDLWCACWFWPADALDRAPIPSRFAVPPEETTLVSRRIAGRHRFFHFELEFPDVFRVAGAGFDAVLGNPPWDIAKPSSKEFFSNIDPLYRAYGKQEALRVQSECFHEEAVERAWLDYSSTFRAQSNLVSYVATPFGDPSESEASQDRFSIVRGGSNATLHDRWRSRRSASLGYADVSHPYRHQGAADLNLYKLFLEQALALLRPGGRLGFIVPSGLYTDHGTVALRRLFLDYCRWEWLFGFENREKVFDIHRSFKFNPIVIQKGGRTDAIRTAFMRHRLEDWESAEAFAISYPRAQVDLLSPSARAILEISNTPDTLALQAMVSVSVALDAWTDGESARYFKDEFDLSKHSRLFPPLPAWKEQGFHVDEYGRWHGPQGEVALPMYEGRMLGAYDFSAKGWVSGKGRGAIWSDVPWAATKCPEPQFLISAAAATSPVYGALPGPRTALKDVTAATNARTIIAAVVARVPCGHTATFVQFPTRSVAGALWLCACLNSFAFDFHMRRRLGGLHATWNYLQEGRIPTVSVDVREGVEAVVARLCLAAPTFAPEWLELRKHAVGRAWKRLWAATPYERLRLRAVADAVLLVSYGLSKDMVRGILTDCDWPRDTLRVRGRRLDPKGLWRVDKDRDPELRHTVLTLIAYDALQEVVRAEGGDSGAGIAAFLAQGGGEGWMLPETLRLADYGLGHDERARHPQPVASRLGPRFSDWQMVQTPEESWRECHLHARNLLGEEGYRDLLSRVEDGRMPTRASMVAEGPVRSPPPRTDPQGRLF